jgi:hypothetical protein
MGSRTVTTVKPGSEGALSATDEKVFVFGYAGSKLDPIRANQRFPRIRQSARPKFWDNADGPRRLCQGRISLLPAEDIPALDQFHVEGHFNLGDLVTVHHRGALLGRCEVCLLPPVGLL